MNQYLCPNKLVSCWKNNTGKLKNILTFKQPQLLWDVCSYWTPYEFSNLEIKLDTAILISCSILIFAWYLVFIPATTKTQFHKHHSTEMKVVQPNEGSETVNYFHLKVCTVSNRCRYVSLESLKYPWELCEVPWGISGYRLETRGLGSFYSIFIHHIPSVHLPQWRVLIFRWYNQPLKTSTAWSTNETTSSIPILAN